MYRVHIWLGLELIPFAQGPKWTYLIKRWQWDVLPMPPSIKVKRNTERIWIRTKEEKGNKGSKDGDEILTFRSHVSGLRQLSRRTCNVKRKWQKEIILSFQGTHGGSVDKFPPRKWFSTPIERMVILPIPIGWKLSTDISHASKARLFSAKLSVFSIRLCHRFCFYRSDTCTCIMHSNGPFLNFAEPFGWLVSAMLLTMRKEQIDSTENKE